MSGQPSRGKIVPEYPGYVLGPHAHLHLGVTRATLSRILNGSAGISAEMALRLSEALGTSAELWIGMQAEFDLWQASKIHRRKIGRLAPA